MPQLWGLRSDGFVMHYLGVNPKEGLGGPPGPPTSFALMRSRSTSQSLSREAASRAAFLIIHPPHCVCSVLPNNSSFLLAAANAVNHGEQLHSAPAQPAAGISENSWCVCPFAEKHPGMRILQLSLRCGVGCGGVLLRLHFY